VPLPARARHETQVVHGDVSGELGTAYGDQRNLYNTQCDTVITAQCDTVITAQCDTVITGRSMNTATSTHLRRSLDTTRHELHFS